MAPADSTNYYTTCIELLDDSSRRPRRALSKCHFHSLHGPRRRPQYAAGDAGTARGAHCGQCRSLRRHTPRVAADGPPRALTPSAPPSQHATPRDVESRGLGERDARGSLRSWERRITRAVRGGQTRGSRLTGARGEHGRREGRPELRELRRAAAS